MLLLLPLTPIEIPVVGGPDVPAGFADRFPQPTVPLAPAKRSTLGGLYGPTPSSGCLPIFPCGYARLAWRFISPSVRLIPAMGATASDGCGPAAPSIQDRWPRAGRSSGAFMASMRAQVRGCLSSDGWVVRAQPDSGIALAAEHTTNLSVPVVACPMAVVNGEDPSVIWSAVTHGAYPALLQEQSVELQQPDAVFVPEPRVSRTDPSCPAALFDGVEPDRQTAFDIERRGLSQHRIVVEVPEKEVAGPAQESANAIGLMTVIDNKVELRTRSYGAEGTAPSLRNCQGIVLSRREAIASQVGDAQTFGLRYGTTFSHRTCLRVLGWLVYGVRRCRKHRRASFYFSPAVIAKPQVGRRRRERGLAHLHWSRTGR